MNVRICADWVEKGLTQEEIDSIPEYSDKNIGDIIGRFEFREEEFNPEENGTERPRNE